MHNMDSTFSKSQPHFESPILVGETSTHVWIRVRGRGSFHVSSGIKRYAAHMIAQGKNSFIIDLEECTGMDSTFMGTMTGIALQVHKTGGEVQVIAAGDRNRASLENLGLDQLIVIRDEKPGELPDLDPPHDAGLVPEKAESARTMLDAHQALVEAMPGNIGIFQDVLEFLEKEVHESEEAGDSRPGE